MDDSEMTPAVASVDERDPTTWLAPFVDVLADAGVIRAAAFNEEPGWWDWAVDLELADVADTTLYAGIEVRGDAEGGINVRGRLSSLHRIRGEHHDYGNFRTRHVRDITAVHGAVTAVMVEVLASVALAARKLAAAQEPAEAAGVIATTVLAG